MLICVLLTGNLVNAQSRRLRIQTRPAEVEVEDEALEDETELTDDYDAQPQSPVQYYTPEPTRASSPSRFASSNDDYNGVYGQPTAATPRQRNDYNRPSVTIAPKTRTQEQTKAPPVQTIRNYNKVNDDGSFTFGYEAADGSFKEETRGTDCVVRGKYGYVDPDGNKREFTYVSGNPCDPNHPDETQDDRSVEDPNEPENVPQNYPQRPIRPVSNRPQQQYSRPAIQTTTHAPTTVFQNNYASSSYADEDEEPENIQLLQQRPQQRPEEVTIRQRPRITATTPSPISAFVTPTRPVSITPRPSYRLQPQTLQTQPPATTYRPNVQFASQKSQPIGFNLPSPTPLSVEPLSKNAYSSPRKPIDFAVEFQKFQQEHNVIQSTTPRGSSPSPSQHPFKPSQKIELSSNPTSNPIYESQLVFDPATGQYDSNLFQQLPQSDGDFSHSNRHQPYIQRPQFSQPQAAHLVSIEQLQQQQRQPLYTRPSTIQQQQSTRAPPQFPQFSQQLYQKEHDNTQVFSSQQLFAQQQELQQQQLQHDRLIAANKRLQPQQQQLQQQPQQRFPQFSAQQSLVPQQSPQGFYYVQPPQHQGTGQIDAFLRGHNIDFN